MSRVRSQKTLNTKKASPEDVWTRCGSLFEDPKEAYLHLLHNTQAGALILDEWEKGFGDCEKPFLVYQSNAAHEFYDRITIYEGKHFCKVLKRFAMSSKNITDLAKDLDLFVRDPSVIREFRASPPTLVVWFDGDPNGDYVSQFVSFKHIPFASS